MKKTILIVLSILGSFSAFSETRVIYGASPQLFTIKSASVKIDRAGPYILLKLDNGEVITHSKVGGYADAKELAADLMNPNSTMKVVKQTGLSEFYVYP